MKTAIKRKNDHFLVIPLKYVNRPRTPKLWAIAHENDNKTRKSRVLGQTSQTRKLPWNSKIVGNNS